jgi:restriction endonuclease Mrr
VTGDILSFISGYLSRLREGLYRIEINRKDLLAELGAGGPVGPTDLAVQFEAHEKSFRETLFIIGWSVYYNVFTDRVIFERILDTNVVARLVELKEKNIRRELLNKIGHLDPIQFENFVANVFRSLPWVRSVNTTKRSHDGGVDLVGIYSDPKARIELPFLGQVKRWGSKVDFPEMTKFLGALELASSRNTIGLYVASHGYTDAAKQAADRFQRRVVLYDAAGLVDLMLENSIGVRRTTMEAVSPDEEFWSELLP